jgi:DNA-directed RNA polymerase subunit RPC12/RpoP
MPDDVWIICTKCGASFARWLMERKQAFACPLCKEPGLRVMSAKGEATEETWPKEAGA